ncbi:DUF4145 domain-containing protein [Pseudomonas kilonensis]|uniref:DUF4145 domain-containing protein n=1 Tax=Pseudomonas kilonensis TaxID=132476 RepID=UPI0020A0BA2D|nr:DUF4145 domain-containing protein [Pseudomonas kilonensis]MCP1457003.1 hypothetical protein [Pseudomonas kilonensis]
MSKYVAPTIEAKAFTCMFCSVLTTMTWFPLSFLKNQRYGRSEFQLCYCDHCGQHSLWLNTTEIDFEDEVPVTGRLILPATAAAPVAHVDLPPDCKVDFEEAREISSRSPRGAAALLRLCLQKLCIALGGKGKRVDDDIGMLVRNGLNPKIQQAFDVVRITGNHAVHPGEISLEENPDHVTVMFEMINLIVEELITRPKQIEDRFNSLPTGALEAISRRDAPKLLTSDGGD